MRNGLPVVSWNEMNNTSMNGYKGEEEEKKTMNLIWI